MRVYPVDQSPSAEAAAYVEGCYDTKLTEWRDDGLVYWTNTDRDTLEIPDRVFGILCDLMENETRHAFKGDNPVAQRMAQEAIILRRLRAQMAKHPSGEQTTFSSY